MARRLIDLSHEIEGGLVTYPGLPAPVVSDFLTREASQAHYAPGTTFHIARIDMVANTGTYVDSPFHRHAAGADLAALPLERLADLDGVVIDARGRAGRAVDADALDGRELGGKAVLIRTGWDRHWQTPRYADGHPFLPRRTVERLVAAAPALVGIDSLNIDDTADPERPAHSLLLGAGIPVAEHLCHLDVLPATGFRVHCVPVRSAASAPSRSGPTRSSAEASVSDISGRALRERRVAAGGWWGGLGGSGSRRSRPKVD